MKKEAQEVVSNLKSFQNLNELFSEGSLEALMKLYEDEKLERVIACDFIFNGQRFLLKLERAE
ncbi:hypothetical protein GHU05_04860 [Fructobacillus tropaeoli]|uniref:hypothetical protein n=1 Tax=Fructobacillus tropaeoli TaxID=709323 RepID=UPI001455FE56|nr:hypothetical protein [Fructobacillus tropaeoli]NLS38258.1 hypothetical protein [Fructobacillus tropaeoli]